MREISTNKRLRIATQQLKKSKIQGKYFKQKHSPNSIFVFSALRNAPSQFYPYLIEQYKGNYKKDIFDQNNLKQLLLVHLEFSDFHSEFDWAKSIIQNEFIKIQRFIELSSNYSHNLLHGEYLKAENLLNEIELEFGNSIWLIKNRISFYEISVGLKKQKQYTNNLKKDLSNGSLAKYLIHNISVRNESQTTISRFRSQVSKTLNQLSDSKQQGYKEFLTYHLFDNEMKDPQELIQVLRISFSSSIVDYYNTFISLLNSMSISEVDNYKQRVRTFLNSIDKLIDPRLESLKLIHCDPEISNLNDFDVSEIELMDNYLKGEFENVFNVINSKSFQYKSYVSKILMQAFCTSFLKVAESNNDIPNQQEGLDLYTRIINGLSRIISYGVIHSSREVNELNKIAINFSDFNWVQAIRIVIENENNLFALHSPNCTLNAIMSSEVHPVLLSYIKGGNLFSSFENYIFKGAYNSSTFKYFKSIEQNTVAIFSDKLHPEFSHHLNSVINFNNHDFNDSISYANKLKESNAHEFHLRRAYGLITYSLYESNQISESIVKSVDFYLKNKSFHTFLPLEKLSFKLILGSSDWRANSNLIEFSILFDCFNRFLNKNFENARRFAYEDFLLKRKINRPSELSTVLDVTDPMIIYYLKNICIESVMDTSGAFSGGSDEVINERLEICRLLSEVDKGNYDLYNQEIQEIVRRQIISSRRKEVDQSRIYVDIASIREWAKTELEESFDRYKTYLSSNYKTETLINFKINDNNIDSAMSIPENEVSELLKIMISEIRDKYLSADIGLDRFISTRIRHGELERNMRIPIQKHELITKKESKVGPYLSNTFWMDKIDAPFEVRSKIDKQFKVFSENYDDLISKIANSWLQINSSSKPNGLFVFSFNSDEFAKIANLITINFSLSEFVDLIIKVLENKLIYNLVSIREALNVEGKKEAKELINSLNTEVSNIFDDPIKSQDLLRAVALARTDLTAQFDKIIEWFFPSSSGDSAPYTIKDAILVAEAIIKEGTESFNVNILDLKDEEFSIHGQLPIFIDIFINIFENVVKRSGLNPPKAEIEIKYKDISDDHFKLCLKVSNSIGSEVDLNQLEANINSIKELLESGSFTKHIAKDRNSGLFKIFKSVNDFSAVGWDEKSQMDFRLKKGNFEIDLEVPFKIFVLDQEENKI